MHTKLLAQLTLLFLVVQALGLYVGYQFLGLGIEATIVSDNPEGIENSLGIIAYMLVITAILLIIIKFVKGKGLYFIFKAVESLAVFGASLLVFATITSDEISIALAFALVFLRNVFPKIVWLRNASSLLATVGAGALIGVSLGILPVIVLLSLLGLYDYIAVFRTKHMVTLAKSVTKQNLAFTFALPTKEHQFELGTGDLVIPLVFSVALLKYSATYLTFPFLAVPSLYVLLASLLGLLVTVDYSSRHVGKALPALPLQVVLMLGMYAVLKFFGF